MNESIRKNLVYLGVLLWVVQWSCCTGCRALGERTTWAEARHQNSGVGLGQSISQLQSQLERVENAPELNVELGKLFLQSGQLLPAARQVQIALNHDGKLTDAWILRGDIERAKSNHSAALANYQHAMNLDGNQELLLESIANCYVALDRPYRAASTVETLMSHYEFGSPPNSVLRLYGQVMQDVGQFSQAADALASACDDADAGAECFVRLSQAQRLSGNPQASRKTLERALTRFPDSALIRQHLKSSDIDHQGIVYR